MRFAKRPLGAQRPPNPRAARDALPFRRPHPDRYPYVLQLEAIAPAALAQAYARGRYSFYLFGDVGGIHNPEPQQRVAEAMVRLSSDGVRYERSGAACGGTAFTYIVGDIVYNHGERAQYLQQFYAPYCRYHPPIVGIPGNHDGDALDGEQSLDGFLANFCADEPLNEEDAGPYGRPAVRIPNPYWTLEAPWLRIIGLYSNVPEGGFIDDEQREWFLEQVARPRGERHLIIALHQPVFSADTVHGGSEAMLSLIHEPAKRAGCRLVVSGHVHNYQRFEYDELHYVVHGAGGYPDLHAVSARDFPGAQYPVQSASGVHGMIHVEVSAGRLVLRPISVPRLPQAGDDALEVERVIIPHHAGIRE